MTALRKTALVPLPGDLPITTILLSAPPICLQLVISPLNIVTYLLHAQIVDRVVGMNHDRDAIQGNHVNHRTHSVGNREPEFLILHGTRHGGDTGAIVKKRSDPLATARPAGADFDVRMLGHIVFRKLPNDRLDGGRALDHNCCDAHRGGREVPGFRGSIDRFCLEPIRDYGGIMGVLSCGGVSPPDATSLSGRIAD